MSAPISTNILHKRMSGMVEALNWVCFPLSKLVIWTRIACLDFCWYALQTRQPGCKWKGLLNSAKIRWDSSSKSLTDKRSLPDILGLHDKSGAPTLRRNFAWLFRQPAFSVASNIFEVAYIALPVYSGNIILLGNIWWRWRFDRVTLFFCFDRR